MKVCFIIVLIICVADLIAEIIEYFYEKFHNWDNDIGYQMWKSIKEDDSRNNPPL